LVIHQQRRDAVRVGLVHVRAGLDQEPRGVEEPVARRKQQRRHAARRRQLLALRRHAAANDAHAVRPAARPRRPRRGLGSHARRRIHRGAGGQQRAHDLGVDQPRRPAERGLRHVRIGSIHLRTALEQEPHRVGALGAHGGHEQSVARDVGSVDVGLGVEQPGEHGGVAVLRRHVDRLDPERVGHTDPRAGANQRVNGREVVSTHRPVQRRGAIRASSVDVVPRLQKGPNRDAVTRGGGADERVVGR
jgi:hypothetical protein